MSDIRSTGCDSIPEDAYASGKETLDPSELNLIKETVQAFERTLYQGLYIIDHIERKFIYVSDNFKSICGIEASEITDKGFDYYKNLISENDYEMFSEILCKRINFINGLPLPERKKYTLFFIININYKDTYRLINHKSIPLKITSDGRLWLELCIISFTGKDKAGSIILQKEGEPYYFQYSLKKEDWEKIPVINLTETETEVLLLSSHGFPMKAIAGILNKSLDSIKHCKRSLFNKMGVNSISAAIIRAQNCKL